MSKIYRFSILYRHSHYISRLDMCWNADVSLNTFLFSLGVLLLIYYNNKYTTYKTDEFNENGWLYVFFVLIIAMQLIEFFLWRNLNNKKYNVMFSIAEMVTLFFQPIASLMLLTDKHLRYICILVYSVIAVPQVAYKVLYNSNTLRTSISKSHHLSWDFNFVSSNYFMFATWLFFFFFSLFYNKWFAAALFGITLLLTNIYVFSLKGSFGSMWCWSTNAAIIDQRIHVYQILTKIILLIIKYLHAYFCRI